jgi:hypothetical protein
MNGRGSSFFLSYGRAMEGFGMYDVGCIGSAIVWAGSIYLLLMSTRGVIKYCLCVCAYEREERNWVGWTEGGGLVGVRFVVILYASRDEALRRSIYR